VQQFMMFLHVLGAVALGFYLFLPIALGKLATLTDQGKLGFVQGVYGISRVCQFVLIVQLLTGGYLMSKNEYTSTWMIIVLILFLVIAAFSGIMGANMKKFLNGTQSGTAHLAKVKMFAAISSLAVLAIIITMVYPMYA